ncbi:MAG: divergent PAP2 family protein [Oscillatoriaceae cyanobacterium]
MTMTEFGDILNNRVLLVAFLACLLAQLSKFFIDFAKNGKPNPQVIFETGGMPSSHSALVTALATGIGQTVGWGSTEFALATIFAAIVMYDAAGVRRAAGNQARILNQIIELFDGHDFTEERLKELLGHTPFQVMVGSVFGVLVACLAGLAY